MYLFVLPLCPCKFNTETYDVAHKYFWQHGQEAIEEEFVPCSSFQCASCQIILIAYVIHTEEHGGHECNHHEAHDALRVDAVVNVYAALGCVVGHEQEGFKAFKHAAESVQSSTFFKIGLYLVDLFSEAHTTCSPFLACPVLRARFAAAPSLMSRGILPVRSLVVLLHKCPVALGGQCRRQ